jgi:glycosyltransferase involved in cell wall biosynthesis
VNFTGKLSKEEWVALSQKYDLFINTTHFDNTPVSVIEAMALGLPIVSTNVGGITYLLEDKKTALLVEDSDVNAMTQAILELLHNNELKEKLVANGLNLVQEFDWEKVKIRWDDVLK